VAQSWHKNLCVAKVWQRVYQRCIGSRLPDLSLLSTTNNINNPNKSKRSQAYDDYAPMAAAAAVSSSYNKENKSSFDEEWRRLVINEWQRYEKLKKPRYYKVETHELLHEICRKVAAADAHYRVQRHDHATYSYCNDRLLIATIHDLIPTPDKWQSKWQSLLVTCQPHGIQVIDELLALGASYDTALFGACIHSADMDMLQILLARNNDKRVQAIIDTLPQSIPLETALLSMGDVYLRTPTKCIDMLNFLIDELHFKFSGKPLEYVIIHPFHVSVSYHHTHSYMA
jgi:hypothetical protein